MASRRKPKTGTLAGLFSRLWYGETLKIRSVGSSAGISFMVQLEHNEAIYSKAIELDFDRTEQEIHDAVLAMLPVVRKIWDAQIKSKQAKQLWKGDRIV